MTPFANAVGFINYKEGWFSSLKVFQCLRILKLLRSQEDKLKLTRLQLIKCLLPIALSRMVELTCAAPPKSWLSIAST